MNREQQDFRQRPAQRTRGTEPGSRDIRGPQDPRRKSPRQEPSDRMRQGRGERRPAGRRKRRRRNAVKGMLLSSALLIVLIALGVAGFLYYRQKGEIGRAHV